MRIALAAKRWADAEEIKAVAAQRFSDAAHECVDWKESEALGRTVWLFARLSGTDPFSGAWKTRWVWRATGEPADDEPRVIRQKEAWVELREARKQAGIARSVLTKMARRWAP